MSLAVAVKNNLKRLVGQPSLAKWSLKDTVSIFVYHEVSDHPSRFCEQHLLNMPPKFFTEHIRFITDHFHVISPDQLLSGQYDTPAALITFDDGMPGYFRQAVPIMAKFKVPSILFINMAPVRGELFWSGLITYLTDSDKNFVRFLHQQKGQHDGIPDFLLCDPHIVDDYLATIKDKEEIFRQVRAFYGEFATMDDVSAMKNEPLVFFGNHFYNHYNAARLSDEQLRDQYLLNQARIDALPQGRPFFAYPFGQPGMCFSSYQTKLLQSWGAKAVFSSSGRINTRNTTGFYDRIGVDIQIQTIEDLMGRIQCGRIKHMLEGNPTKEPELCPVP